MNESFGPWSTAMTTGTQPQLNTFWKRRLALLSSLKQSKMRITNRAALALVILAIGGLAMPTWKPAIDEVLAGQAEKPKSGGISSGEGAASGAVAPVGAGAKGDEAVEDEIVEYFPRPSAAEQRILVALEMSVNAEFQARPLVDCLDVLATQAKIDVILDRVKLAEEAVPPDQPITLRIKGPRLDSALHLLLEPLGLEYFYEDDVLKITTATVAGDKLVTRTYPVGDLCPELKVDKEPAEPKSAGLDHGNSTVKLALFQGFGGGGLGGIGAPQGNGGGGRGGGGMLVVGRGNRFAALMNAITTSIRPDSWEELSGPGSVVSVATTNCLVIRQTQSVHREVLQLLRDLRSAKRVPHPVPQRNAVDGNPRD
jgi:hypothetical protein